MAFDINNFKEAGGPGNSPDGGQMYSLWSDEDTVATMLASGYLDDLSSVLNVRDMIALTGTDGGVVVQVSGKTVAGVITTKVALTVGSTFQALSGAGAVDIITPVTLVTSGGADALTLADGAVGQVKIVTLAVDGGTPVLTPATAHGWTTATFADAGDTVQLLWGSALGWIVTGQGGLSTGPVIA